MYATAGIEGIFDLSQQIDRMRCSTTVAPCMTPAGELFNTVQGRLFSGAEKLIFQCFPLQKLHLQHLTEPVSWLRYRRMFRSCCHMSAGIAFAGRECLALSYCHFPPEENDAWPFEAMHCRAVAAAFCTAISCSDASKFHLAALAKLG